jgi:hypothetical protein
MHSIVGGGSGGGVMEKVTLSNVKIICRVIRGLDTLSTHAPREGDDVFVFRFADDVFLIQMPASPDQVFGAVVVHKFYWSAEATHRHST